MFICNVFFNSIDICYIIKIFHQLKYIFIYDSKKKFSENEISTKIKSLKINNINCLFIANNLSNWIN